MTKINPNTGWAGQVLHYLKETGSTNEDCKKLMMQGAPHGVLVVADSQTTGKGRRGRSWISPPEVAAYMSLGLRPDFPPEKASMLTLVMALAVAEAVEEVSGLAAGIKWPNDIVVNQKKVCGILTEMHLETANMIHTQPKKENPDETGEEREKSRGYSVIIGVGINVNQSVFDEEIGATATSLLLEKKEPVSREQLIEKTMECFETHYDRFLQTCDLSQLKAEYEKKLVNRDARVRVLDPKGEYSAIATGINFRGELLVKKEDGTTAEVYAGEVSVRGIYGYV